MIDHYRLAIGFYVDIPRTCIGDSSFKLFMIISSTSTSSVPYVRWMGVWV